MQEYIVQPGDTLYSIARQFEITTGRLRSLNPEAENTDVIFVGQTLRIPTSAEVRPTIEVNGYVYPVHDPVEYSIVFPFLTFLSIFGYEIRRGGLLIAPHNTPLITAARQAGVAPLMAVTNTMEGVYSGELLHGILSDPQAQQALIENSVATAQAYGYSGVVFGFENIFPEDYASYAIFLELVANELHAIGLIIVISIRLVVILESISVLTEALSLYSRILDRLIITPGDIICAENVDPLDVVQQGLDYAFQYISRPKILLGVPNCCYEWEDPYAPGDEYYVRSLTEAEALVRLTGASPETEPYTQKTLFRILEEGKPPRVLMCDSIKILQVMKLIEIYNLGGVSFRTLNLFNFASFQAITVRYDIHKVLPYSGNTNG